MSLRTDNLIIPQGVSWETRWPVVDESGEPTDLTGWQARAHARSQKLSDTTVHEWSTALGNADIGDSWVALRVDPADSSAWNWRKAYYDLEIFHSDGRVLRITQGTVEVDIEVTR